MIFAADTLTCLCSTIIRLVTWCQCPGRMMRVPYYLVLVLQGRRKCWPLAMTGERPNKRKAVSAHAIRSSLQQLARGQCKCARTATVVRPSCYSQFQHTMDELVQLRVNLANLHKLDADRKATLLTTAFFRHRFNSICSHYHCKLNCF